MEKTVHIVVYEKDRKLLQKRKQIDKNHPPIRDIVRGLLK